MLVYCIILFNKDMHYMMYQIFNIVTVLLSNMQSSIELPFTFNS